MNTIKPYVDYVYEPEHGYLTDELLTKVRQRISQHISWHKGFYIGQTNGPEARNNRHHKAGKKHYRMVLLYKTSSKKFCDKMEALLIEEYRNHYKYSHLCHNKIAGGSGRLGQGPYYIYILLY